MMRILDIQCVQCQSYLASETMKTQHGDWFNLWYCNDPKCSNYGLYQRGIMKPKKYDNWHLCYECGVKEYGEPAKEDMEGITVMAGKCPVCGKKKTLIPRSDFLGIGD